MSDRSGRPEGRRVAVQMEDAAAALAAICIGAAAWRYQAPGRHGPWSWTISNPPPPTVASIQRWCATHRGASCRTLAGPADQLVYVVSGSVVLARVTQAPRRHGNR